MSDFSLRRQQMPVSRNDMKKDEKWRQQENGFDQIWQLLRDIS